MEQSAPETEGSKPFQVFEANVLRLISLAGTPRSSISETMDRLRQQTETSTADAQNLGEVMRAWRGGGQDSAVFQEHAAPLLADLTKTNQAITDLVSLIKTRQFLGTWMVVMLVTFAEAYLEEAFLLLIEGGFGGSSLPKAAVDDFAHKWAKNLIRGGNPHALAQTATTIRSNRLLRRSCG